jgi:hypothetical protein
MSSKLPVKILNQHAFKIIWMSACDIPLVVYKEQRMKPIIVMLQKAETLASHAAITVNR